MAQDVAQRCPVVPRKRKFTTTTLAQTFILGFFAHPRASDEQLAQIAAALGVDVSAQAVAQRFTARLEAFLKELLQQALSQLIGSPRALAPLLERFTAVLLLDSSTISLPDQLRDRFCGCGGSGTRGRAAMKMQVQWDLRHGGLDQVAFEPGRSSDVNSPLQTAAVRPGALRITDLGYFDLEVFQAISRRSGYWLSRLRFGTSVLDRAGQPLELLSWLAQQPGPYVDQPIRLGAQDKLACRIVAWRVPQEVASRRRQKLIVQTRRKHGSTPSQERLAWCDWTILVTNAPGELLSAQEAAVCYGARWQIELLFKRWKSLGLIAELTGATSTAVMVRIWARLLAVLLQHWLLLCTVWGQVRASPARACKAIRSHAQMIIETVNDPQRLAGAIERLDQIMARRVRQNKRKKPSCFELLNEPARLAYP